MTCTCRIRFNFLLKPLFPSMKSLLCTLLAAAALAFAGCQSVGRQIPSKQLEATLQQKESDAMSMQKTCQFLKEAGTYYIATMDGDQPRVRPYGTIHIFEGRLYIQTGRVKNVAKQLMANGKVELCAMKGGEWIRVSGTLVEDPRREAKVSMLDDYESLKGMYSPDDGNTMVLYFQPGTVTATVWSFDHAPEVMHF